MERMSGHTGLISSYQLLITAACTNTPEQLTGAHLYLDLVMSGYLCHTVGNVMDLQLCWLMPSLSHNGLTHWGRVTHICVGTLTIIGSDNGLSPSRRQAIIWTNAGLLLIGPLGKNFNEISIKFLSFPFKKLRLKVSSAKWRSFCLRLNVLTKEQTDEKWMKRMNAVFAPFSRFELTRCVLIIHHFLWDPLNQRSFIARMKYYIKTTLNVITYSYPQFEYTMLLEEITGIHGGKWKLWR